MTAAGLTRLSRRQVQVVRALRVTDHLGEVAELVGDSYGAVHQAARRLRERGVVELVAPPDWGGCRGCWAGVWGLTELGERVADEVCP